MSVLQNVEAALAGTVPVSMGRYPETTGDAGKIVFTGEDKPVRFMGGGQADIETFKVVLRGDNYNSLEQKADAVRAALKNAGFIQIGGYEDVEPRAGETSMQISIRFKVIKY